jgi:hypothetical protein
MSVECQIMDSASGSVCDDTPTHAVALVLGHDVDGGTETDYDYFFTCSEHVPSEVGKWTLDDGISDHIIAKYQEYAFVGWSVLEAECSAILR